MINVLNNVLYQLQPGVVHGGGRGEISNLNNKDNTYKVMVIIIFIEDDIIDLL